MPMKRAGYSKQAKSLGRPTGQGAASSQGITSTYRGVVQGKFTGDARFAKNLKQAAPQAPGAKAWPNAGTVYRGRLRY